MKRANSHLLMTVMWNDWKPKKSYQMDLAVRSVLWTAVSNGNELCTVQVYHLLTKDISYNIQNLYGVKTAVLNSGTFICFSLYSCTSVGIKRSFGLSVFLLQFSSLMSELGNFLFGGICFMMYGHLRCNCECAVLLSLWLFSVRGNNVRQWYLASLCMEATFGYWHHHKLNGCEVNIGPKKILICCGAAQAGCAVSAGTLCVCSCVNWSGREAVYILIQNNEENASFQVQTSVYY